MSNENNAEMTQGQERALAKKKEAEKAAKAEKRSRIWFNIVTILLLAAIVFGIVLSVVNGIKAKKEEERKLAYAVPMATTFSEGLMDNGFVEGVNEDDYVTLTFDPKKSIEIPYSSIEYTDEDIQNKITELLNDNPDEEGNVSEEFDEDFIKNNLGSSLTVEEYKAKIKEDGENAKKVEYVKNYVRACFTLIDIPADYALKVAGMIKLMDQQQFDYINQFYMAYTGGVGYVSVAEMRDMTEEGYEEFLKEQGNKEAAIDLAYQAIYKALGLNITEEEYNTYLTNNGITDITLYGKGYIYKTLMYEKINNYLLDNATIKK